MSVVRNQRNKKIGNGGVATKKSGRLSCILVHYSFVSLPSHYLNKQANKKR